MNLCCLCIQFVVTTLASDWFFYSVSYHETSKLVESSQTGLQWRISLGLSFVLEPYNLATLLKQTISYQLFSIKKYSGQYSVLIKMHIVTGNEKLYEIYFKNLYFQNVFAFIDPFYRYHYIRYFIYSYCMLRHVCTICTEAATGCVL